MSDLRHVVSVSTGATTAAVGAAGAGLTLADWQSIASIVACCVGIVLSCAAAVWRYREYRQRMSQ